jgi:hypothetical protein
MKARNTSKPMEQPEEGSHFARLVGIVDLGHQPGFEWQGKEVESAYKIRLSYELVNSKMSDGRPFWVHEDITNSDNEKSTLALRVRTLKGSFDNLFGMIGSPCLVTVKLDKKGYAKVDGQGGVAQVPGGMEVAPLSNPSFTFSLEEPDLKVFESLPEFVQNRIKENLDYSGSTLETALNNDTAPY